MPNWKKLIVSGSDAALNTVTAVAFTGSLFGTGSWAVSSSRAISASYALSASYAPSTGVGSQWTSSAANIYYNLGNVGIGINSPLARTHIKGAGSTSSTTTLLIENSIPETILSITDDKNIGILTTTPGAALDIAQSGVGGDYNALFLRAGNSSTTSGSNQILFGYSAQTNYAHAIKTRHNAAAAAGNNIDFYTWKFGDTANTSSGQFVMTMAGNGSVGVGTKTPAFTLDTSGSGRFTSGLVVTGSLKGNVTTLSIASSTASMDLSTGNFYTLTLGGGATNINPTNITAGQTTTIVVTTSPGSSVTFPTTVKQPSGSAYTPTTGTAKDVLTFIAVDTTAIYLANVKNLI